MKIDRVKIPMVDINYKAIVNGENPIAKVEKISWEQLREENNG